MPAAKSARTSDAGLWLAIGAMLLAAVLPAHGPVAADLSVQMQHIADGHGQWSVVHWLAALALVLLSGAGFMFFVETTIGRRSGPPAGAWLLFAIGSLLTVGTAVSEATAISRAADAGDLETFLTWWLFASGLGNGFMVVALAAAVIAWASASAETPPMPAWLCRAGAVVAMLSAIGWILGMILQLAIGGPVWFLATLAMALWLAWYGYCARGAAGAA